jgi:hypothetical protein
MSKVKQNKKGHYILTINGYQYLEIVDFVDAMPGYQANSQYTALQRVWNIVLQKLKDRFVMQPRVLEDEMKVPFRQEEAVVLTELFFRFKPQDTLLNGIMQDLHQKIVG